MLLKLGGYSAFLVSIFLVIFFSLEREPVAEAGVLDARTWNFKENRLALRGKWIFFQNELLTPPQCRVRQGSYRNYPALWNTLERDGIGYGTYYLKVVVPDSVLTFAVEIPQLYSSCKLWINDCLIASVGKVGRTKETTVPQWTYKTASFDHSKDTMSIVLQIANFHHYKGGATNPIMLGSLHRVISNKHLTLGTNIAELVLLFITGGAFLYLSWRKKNDKKVILFFSLLCLTWCLRAAFSNQYPIVSIFPNFNWTILVKIEYLTLYGGMIWATLFFSQLMKNISSQILIYLIVGMNIFFSVFTLLTPPIIFSHWIMVYLTIATITVIYVALIILRALFLNQAGAWFLLSSLFLGVLVFGYDIFAYESSQYNLVLLNIGYTAIFALTTLALLFHLGILKEKWNGGDVLTFNEMTSDFSTGDKD